MRFKFVVFRYQPDLSKDKWTPLGVVVENRVHDGTEIAVVCMQGIKIEGTSELSSAMLQDLAAILRREVEECRVRLRPGDDFLEILRARCPWNFHFTIPQEEQIRSDDILEAAVECFVKHVLRVERGLRPRAERKVSTLIQPKRMEAFELAV
jgi:hypothetical protein